MARHSRLRGNDEDKCIFGMGLELSLLVLACWAGILIRLFALRFACVALVLFDCGAGGCCIFYACSAYFDLDGVERFAT